MTDPQHPAFPTDSGYEGLTKREWLAAMAMNGLLAGGSQGFYYGPIGEMNPPQSCAKEAVQFADALIAELNK